MDENNLVFFKFYSFNWHHNVDLDKTSFFLDALERKYFYLQDISNLNDAFERKANIVCELARNKKDLKNKKEKLIRFLKLMKKKHSKDGFPSVKGLKFMSAVEFNEELKKHADLFRQSFNSNVLKNVRVCCFTKNIDNLLMWSHYSDGMKGVCIEYDLSDYSDLDSRMHKVEYIKGYYEIDFWSLIERDTRFLNELHSAKPGQWEYEKEYRLIGEHYRDAVFFDEEDVLSIVFGCKIENSDLNKVMNIISKWKVKPKIKVAFPNEDGFGIKMQECLDKKEVNAAIDNYNKKNSIVQKVRFK